MKRVAIIQSNYIPWKGYFDIIAAVDEFIIYDDMQFTKNDWRNRNKIKTPQGINWLTIPVGQDINRRIRDVELSTHDWQAKHWKTLEINYRRSKYFEEIAAWLKPLYSNSYTHLSDLNRTFIESICTYLDIKTAIRYSWDYKLGDGKTERLIDLCIQAKATEYISGPAAKGYLDNTLFLQNDINLTWFDYSKYEPYPQLWGEFCHEVTILDLLFNCGKESTKYMRSLS